MSLNISKLENIRKHSGKITARCPACAEAGHDRKGEHLVINADGSFGCVVYPGDSVDAKAHRKRIFALRGDRKIKPLIVRSPSVGRLGRVNQSQSAGQPLKTGLLGRLGRVNEHHSAAEAPLKTGLLGRLGRGFESHLEPKRGPAQRENHKVDEHQLNDCGKGVLGVLNHSSRAPDPPLTEQEQALLMRAYGVDDIILEARKLFNATIVAIERDPPSQIVTPKQERLTQ